MNADQGYTYLCNMAKSTGLPIVVHHYNELDARRTKPKYHITIRGRSVGPVLDYTNMNHFLLGMVLIKDEDREAAGVPEFTEPQSYQFEIRRTIRVIESETFEIEAKSKEEAIRLAKEKFEDGYDMNSGNHFEMIAGTESVIEPDAEATEKLIDTDSQETLATNLQ